jgi:hypothetical protein
MTWLDLSDCRVSDRGLKILSKCENEQIHGKSSSDATSQASGRAHSQGIRGLIKLKWLRVCGTLVTREGATAATTSFPALCCVEFGTVAFPDRLGAAGGRESHRDSHANKTETVIILSCCSHVTKVSPMHTSRRSRDQEMNIKICMRTENQHS